MHQSHQDGAAQVESVTGSGVWTALTPLLSGYFGVGGGLSVASRQQNFDVFSVFDTWNKLLDGAFMIQLTLSSAELFSFTKVQRFGSSQCM